MVGHRSSRLHEIGDRIHGNNGEDTFWLLRKQAEMAKRLVAEGKGAAACSLLVGIASHLCADVTMHPMVYYFTGNYYTHAKAVERHRRLESLLDMAATRLDGNQKAPQIRHLLKAAPLEGTYPVEALATLGETSPATLHQELAQAFRLVAQVQRHIQNPAEAWLAHLLRPIMPQSVRDFFALFYAPQLKSYLPLVQSPLHYRHPVTGDQLENTLDGLLDASAQQAATLLQAMEDYVYGDGELGLPQPGPSLDTGLPGVGTDQAVHFADVPLPPL